MKAVNTERNRLQERQRSRAGRRGCERVQETERVRDRGCERERVQERGGERERERG